MAKAPKAYSYRTVSIANTPAVYVINETDSVIYTVTFGGRIPRCCCPQYIHRCAGTLRKCHHIEDAEKHLARETQPAPAPKLPVTLAQRVAADPIWDAGGDW